MVDKFFDKKTKGSGVTLANKSAINAIPQNKQLTEELYKPIIRKFKKREVYSAFKDNIWAIHKPIVRKLKKGKYIQHSKTIFGLQIWQICN